MNASVLTPEALQEAALRIFTSALDGCNIATAFDRHLHFDGNTLVLHPAQGVTPEQIPLERFKKIFIVAMGKAALSMTEALLARLPPKLKIQGVCSAPTVPKKHPRQIDFFAGGHPLPNKESFAAAKATLNLLSHAGKDTFVFFLISGGGSAMLELPLDKRISLNDTIGFHETLVASGATITEINTVRKYFSAVKGGRLALAAPYAEKLSLLLADVPLKDLAAVASSPTLPDKSTLAEAQALLVRYQLLEKFPLSVREYFLRLGQGAGNAPAKPFRAKKEVDPAVAFGGSRLDTLLSNHDFVNAAREAARGRGFKVVIDNTCDDWDYQDAAEYLLKRFHELRREHSRLCLLSSGEVTVKLGPNPGCGGRNQQFALTCALDLAKYEGESLAVLSAGSDGIDGDSPAAGAICDTTTVARARTFGFDPIETLARFDTCTLFTALGDTVVTGPTGNNLRDLRVLLAVRE